MILVSGAVEHDRFHPNGFGPISEELAGGSGPLDPDVSTLGLEVGEIGAKRGKTHQRPPRIVIDQVDADAGDAFGIAETQAVSAEGDIQGLGDGPRRVEKKG